MFNIVILIFFLNYVYCILFVNQLVNLPILGNSPNKILKYVKLYNYNVKLIIKVV